MPSDGDSPNELIPTIRELLAKGKTNIEHSRALLSKLLKMFDDFYEFRRKSPTSLN